MFDSLNNIQMAREKGKKSYNCTGMLLLEHLQLNYVHSKMDSLA
jgi:hypothetical protein